VKLPNTARLLSLRAENDRQRLKMEALRPRFDRIAGRHENGTAPRAVTAWQLFQTPPEIAARLAAMLNLQPGARILEPSAGLGRLIDAASAYDPREIVAVEMDSSVAGELRRRGQPVIERDFLNTESDELGSFDAVIMNPPFHLRADIRHIEHARTFLNHGGRLAAVCMGTDHRRARLKPDALEWIELEAGAFASSGTQVPVFLCTFTL